ncbi:MAG: hypothetical protein EHM79_18690 [Geobacter sp.]|nr:MAG: hypothetical protein EHM79_18690 [Geobacter sp.]
MFNDPCYKGGQKHNFEARYDETPSGLKSIKSAYGTTPDDLRSLFFLKTYVRDVCTWCGKTIERR